MNDRSLVWRGATLVASVSMSAHGPVALFFDAAFAARVHADYAFLARKAGTGFVSVVLA